MDAPAAPTNEPATADIKLIVGVGASAGGLEALERLFDSMPEKTGCVFVVVQHLSPDFKSMLDQLLARRTKIPILLAQDQMQLRPDTIVLNPPKKQMIISGGTVYLTEKDPTELVSHPIDVFFRSLAQEGARAVAIVLSGTGSDGSRGLRDVHAAGGCVIAQSVDSAGFDGMPSSAIDTGLADRVLPPEEIPDVLLDLMKSGKLAPVSLEIDSNDPGLVQILRLLNDAYRIDFSVYKQATILRRTQRRAELAQAGTLADYAARLLKDPAELDLLYKDLLIGVTRFFRDSVAFARLSREVLPQLIRDLPAGEELRIWVAGCATGEEAYSIAIVVREQMDAVGRVVPVKIFATDVHHDSLRIAGLASYDAAALADVSPERRHNYFVAKDGRYQVTPEVRSMVVFAPHNVLKDAPFTNLDLVSCRNLLIYFDLAAQRKVLSMFHFSLRMRGYLFLGPSETPGELAEEFDSVDHHWRIFRKRRDVRLTPVMRFSVSRQERSRVEMQSVAATRSDTALLGAYDALLEEFMPPGFLVNARRELLHTFAGASQFLRPRDGRRTVDLADMLDGDLRVAVIGAIQRVLVERTAVIYKGMRIEHADGPRPVDVMVRPIRTRRGGDVFALVTLQPSANAQPLEPSEPAPVPMEEARREHIQALETELKYTRENLQTTVEEMETSNEELQATNEELVASNEELQSTNEELHSVNEELHTVNSEFQRKISELVELNADMDHLQVATEVHTLFVDKQLRIRKFTPHIAETFSLVPHDIGRSIEVFAHNLRRASLVDDIRTVAEQGQSFEEHVQDSAGRWFLLRILPYRRGTSLEGAVLTLIDVSRLRKAQAETERMQMLLSSILRNTPSHICIKDQQHRYVLVDDGFRALAGRDPVGLTTEQLFPPDQARQLLEGEDDVSTRGVVAHSDISLPTPAGLRHYLSMKFPLREADGAMGVGCINTDITSIKQAQQELHNAIAQRDRFLAMLSHELRNPLAALYNSASVLGRHPLGPQERGWQTIILDGARQMKHLLDDLLDVARITQDKLTLDRVDLDLRSIVELSMHSVAQAAADKRIEITQHIASDAIPVSGDTLRLQQVLTNLLVNAVRYTPSGGHVELTVERDGDMAVLRVRDDGIGIDAQMLDRVFEPFVQGHAPGARGKDGGLGVGLALVRHLVALHGGAVTAHSAGANRGSEFVVRIPVLAQPQDKPQAAPAVGEPATAGLLRVLLVEDDANGREGLKELLAMDGHTVFDVGSGEAAVAALGQASPDVVLLDLGLPGIDGYETQRQLRAQQPELPVIALTGFGQASDVERTKAAGFYAHVTKPINLDELYAVLAHVRPRDRAIPSAGR